MPAAGRPPTGPTRVRLLGRFAVAVDGRDLADREVGTRKARTLLKVLGVRSPHPVPSDELAQAVWPREPPQDPGANLATLVSRLRAVLGPEVVVGDRNAWGLGPQVETDLQAVSAYVVEAAERASAGEPALALTAALAALASAGDGRVLTEESAAEWAEPARQDLQRLIRQARHAGAAASLDLGDPTTAARLAAEAVEADSFDEAAVRLLMLAHQSAGEAARGLAAYERLRVATAAELGADPAPQTRQLHLDLLADSVGGRRDRRGRRPTVARPRRTGALVGRDAEVARLAELWTRAVEGTPGLVLLCGEAGIGKTRLATEVAGLATATGGTVLEARCYDAERSLFLQPFVDAIRPEVLRSTAAQLREVAGDRAPTLASLVPEVADVLGPLPRDPATAETERRLAYEALLGFLRRRSARSPVLLVLDDVHNAPLATLELMHLLPRRVAGARLLVVGTVRSEEGRAALTALDDVALRLDLGPLEDDAVLALAAEHGQAEHAPRLMTRTRGHPLFVVESLLALCEGEVGVPASLLATIEARVRGAGPGLEDLARAASVLGASFDARMLAELLDEDAVRVVRGCEDLVRARLVLTAGPEYEFANDLVQEVLYATTSQPLREVYHRRAADLLADRPESAAPHAEASGQWARSSRAWLAAGLGAASRFAVADGEGLLSRAVLAADRSGEVELVASARLQRGRLRLILQDFTGSLDDFSVALDLAHSQGLRTLEVLLHRELAGDVQVSLGRPVAACEPHLSAGLALARALGDPTREADLLARSAVLATSRLQFDRAIVEGRRAVERARPLDDPVALLLALDGLKTAYAYLGDLDHLTEAVDELEPLCRARKDLFALQWCVFERAFVPMAAGDWVGAALLMEEALALSQRSGWVAFESWFRCHLGWLARLAGRPDEAVAHGRRSVGDQQGARHPWWHSTSCALLATTLLTTEPTPPPEAVRLLRQGLASADRTGAESFRLRCLAGLAWATGSPELRDQAQLLLDEMRLPAGFAWMHGTDAYLALARAWIDADEPGRARAVLEPLHRNGRAAGWGALLDASGLPELMASVGSAPATVAGRQRRSTKRAAARSTPPDATGR